MNLSVLQGALIAAFSALVTGAGIYVGFARVVLTRAEHEKECKKNTAPITKEITEIKESILRAEEKRDKSEKNLQNKLDKIFLELLRMNGKAKGL
jgi:hypothetical protein